LFFVIVVSSAVMTSELNISAAL